MTNEFADRRTIDIRILDERIRSHLPAYSTPGSAGMDLRACIDGPLTISPGEAQLIATGISMHLGDPNLAALVLPRSGLGHKHGVPKAVEAAGLIERAMERVIAQRTALTPDLGGKASTSQMGNAVAGAIAEI